MIINRKAWHYYVYDFTYALSGNTPNTTNLCQYVRRIMLMGPIVGAACLVLLAFGIVMVTVCCIFGPIIGYVPVTWKKPWTILDTKGRYQGLKLGKSYDAFQLYPWHFLLLLIIGFIEYAWYGAEGPHPLVVQGEVVGTIVAIIAVIFGIFVYLDSRTGQLINQYVAAKKAKVCPVIEFSNKESQ